MNSLGGRGGIERVTIVKANAMAEIQDNEVAICYTDKGSYPTTIHPLSPKVKVFDLGTPYWGFTSLRTVVQKFVSTVLATRKSLKLVIEEFQPDIVISTGSYEKFALALINRTSKDKFKKIREFHFASTYRDFLGGSHILKHAAAFLDNKVLTRFYDKNFLLTRRDMEENFHGKKRFDFMPNPCSFTTVCSDTAIRSKTVLAVGRLVEQKGFNELLDIWALIKGKAIGWKLKIIGAGHLENCLKSQAMQLGIADVVEFAGFSFDVQTEMRKASAFVMTSVYDGCALVMIEAMHEGLPCVSFNLPYGPSEIIEDGENGYLINGRDKYDFARKLLLLLNNNDLRKNMAREASKSVLQFSPEQIAEKWIMKYTELLRK